MFCLYLAPFHATSCEFTIQSAPRNKYANILLLLLLFDFVSPQKETVLRIKALYYSYQKVILSYIGLSQSVYNPVEIDCP